MVREGILIEIVFAKRQQFVALSLRVSAGCTLEDAVVFSGILAEIEARTGSALNLAQTPVGIWGVVKPLETVLSAGDRIEIYQPLVADPKVWRSRQVHQQAKQARRERQALNEQRVRQQQERSTI